MNQPLLPKSHSARRLKIVPAALQGRAANLRHFSGFSLAHHEDPRFRPLVRAQPHEALKPMSISEEVGGNWRGSQSGGNNQQLPEPREWMMIAPGGVQRDQDADAPYPEDNTVIPRRNMMYGGGDGPMMPGGGACQQFMAPMMPTPIQFGNEGMVGGGTSSSNAMPRGVPQRRPTIDEQDSSPGGAMPPQCWAFMVPQGAKPGMAGAEAMQMPYFPMQTAMMPPQQPMRHADPRFFSG
jgi:hypothetical protein